MTKSILQPPLAPQITRSSSKTNFLSKLLIKIGLKHKHIQDFESLIQLHEASSSKALNEITDYEPETVDTSEEIEDIKIPKKEMVSLDLLDTKKKSSQKKPSKIIDFTKDSDEKKINGAVSNYFLQDNDYEFKSSLSSDFTSDEKLDNSNKQSTSSWLNSSEDSSPKANDSSFLKDSETDLIKDENEENNSSHNKLIKESLFTKDPEKGDMS